MATVVELTGFAPNVHVWFHRIDTMLPIREKDNGGDRWTRRYETPAAIASKKLSGNIKRAGASWSVTLTYLRNISENACTVNGAPSLRLLTSTYAPRLLNARASHRSES